MTNKKVNEKEHLLITTYEIDREKRHIGQKNSDWTKSKKISKFRRKTVNLVAKSHTKETNN